MNSEVISRITSSDQAAEHKFCDRSSRENWCTHVCWLGMFSYAIGRRNRLSPWKFKPAPKATVKHLVEVNFYAIYEWDSSISGRSHKQVG